MSGWVLKQRPDGKCDLVPREKVAEWLEKHKPKTASNWKPRKIERGSWVLRDGKLIAKHLAPPRHRTKGEGLQVIKDSEPFLNIAIDGGYIGGRRQRRDMMRAHNIQEVGNEAPINRKQPIEFSTRQFAEDLKQGYRQHGVDVL